MNKELGQAGGALFGLASRNVIVSAAGSVLSYLSFMLAAYIFGATAQTDVFLFASGFVAVLSALITTVFSAVFLPLYIRYLHEGGEERANNFANSLFFYLVAVSVVVGVAIFLFPSGIFSIISKFNIDILIANERILKYFSVVFALTVINEYLRVILQAKNAFVSAAQSIVLQPAVNVVGVLLFADIIGYESLAISAAASRVFQFIFLAAQMKTIGLMLRLARTFNADLVEFFRVVKPFWFASIVTMFSVFFFDYVASGLPAGQLTALVYAQKIYTLPISLLAMPVIEVLNTRLSSLAARGEVEALGLLYSSSVKLAMLIMFPLGILMSFNASEISTILLGRGAYSAESLAITTHALKFFCLVIPCVVIFSISGRVSLALHKTKMPSLFGSIGYVLMMGCVFMAASRFGYIGLPVAKLLVESLYFLPFGFFVVWIYVPSTPFLSIFKEISKVGSAAAFSLGGVWWLAPLIPAVSSSALIYLFVTSVLFIVFFGALCVLFKLDSVSFILKFRFKGL